MARLATGRHDLGVEEVRRHDDDELCGHVRSGADGRWRALTVFGAEIGAHDGRADAVAQVLDEGLAVLADRWTLVHPGAAESETVCILEANADEVVVARGYYSLPGVPTLIISAEQLTSGEWELRR